jgi:hypothetical protein
VAEDESILANYRVATVSFAALGIPLLARRLPFVLLRIQTIPSLLVLIAARLVGILRSLFLVSSGDGHGGSS